MTHPLVLQLRFARREFERGLQGVTAEDALRRIEPMNSIGWTVGHLAAQEQGYWLTQSQGLTPHPEVNVCASGQPASTPPMDEMLRAWQLVTAEADRFLEALDGKSLLEHTMRRTPPYEPIKDDAGTRILRVIYHYWFHTGEVQAMRQAYGHRDLPQFVGAIGDEAPYVPEVS